jgi:hypothetical protein
MCHHEESRRRRRGGGENDPFLSDHSNPHDVGTSRAALIPGDKFAHDMEDDGHREDDLAHLTANMSRYPVTRRPKFHS